MSALFHIHVVHYRLFLLSVPSGAPLQVIDLTQSEEDKSTEHPTPSNNRLQNYERSTSSGSTSSQCETTSETEREGGGDGGMGLCYSYLLPHSKPRLARRYDCKWSGGMPPPPPEYFVFYVV